MAEKTLNTIIVLRNGSKEAWEADGSYILTAGEVGVGYMDVKSADGAEVIKTVPIIKVGDGSTSWKNLPQAEGVFENDVVLTSTLGQYVPTSAGYIKVEGSKGMTTSEFLLSALSQVKEPVIKAPTFSLSATSLGTKEVGTSISSLAWTGTFTTGEYEFGSVDGATTYTKAQGSGQTAQSYTVTCTLDGTCEQKEDGKVVLTNPIIVDEDGASNFASVTSICAWNASTRTPFNNVGVETNGKLGAGSDTKTVNYSVGAYREGFYYGTSTTAVAAGDIDSNFIRTKLSKTGAKYAAGKKTVSVPVGAASIILACPKSAKGVTDVLNTTVNAGMNDAFGLTAPTVVSVGGADATATSVGNFPADYNVWVYTPAEAYGSTASLTVTLG